jgi:hypothetical protein
VAKLGQTHYDATPRHPALRLTHCRQKGRKQGHGARRKERGGKETRTGRKTAYMRDGNHSSPISRCLSFNENPASLSDHLHPSLLPSALWLSGKVAPILMILLDIHSDCCQIEQNAIPG